MKRVTLIIFLFISGISYQSFGQTNKKQFEDLFSKKDTAAQIKLLRKWEAQDSNDAELYAAYFNYYVYKSRMESISIDNKQKSKDSFQIKDSTSKTVGYLNSKTVFIDKYLKLGFDYIDKGIMKFPTRLDMRFGKVSMLGEIKDYQNFTLEILKTIDYSDIIQNKWTWTNNELVDKPENFMLEAIQHFVVQLYNTGDVSLRDYMKRISETVLKYNPDHVESLSNLSVVYLLKYDFDKAIEVLLKAEQLAPQDHIVLGNIAQAYKLKGDKKNAIKYYELTGKFGDEKTKAFAKGEIEKLNVK